MNLKLRRFAPLGLYLALAAALISTGLFIVQRQFNLFLQIALSLVVIGLALFSILDPGRVRQAFTGRQARYGSNALIMGIAFLGIVVVVNFLGYKYNQRWDLTEDKQHTLSPETIQALQSLPQKVSAEAFYTKRTPSDQAKTLLDDLRYNSKGNFDYKFIDPEADPVTAQNAHVQQDGTIVLQMGSRQESLTSTSEQDFTSSLIRLTNPGPRVIYFLTGHGERDPNGTDQNGMSDAKTALESKSYTVKTLNLIASPQIPTDAKVIVVAGPTKPITDNEMKLITGFVDKGGGLVVMEEPTILTDFGSSPDLLADYLANTWNIELSNDLIIDQTVNPPTIAAAAEYGTSPITDKIKTIVTVFPTARSVVAKNSGSAAAVNPVMLVKTAAEAWGETNFADLNNNKVNYDQGKDLGGPLPIAAAAQITDKNARLVVVGDSDFASNATYLSYANGDFLVNSIDWTARQDNLINLTPKTNTQRVMLPPQPYLMNLILLGSVFVIPGAVVASGILSWLQRRRKG